MVAHQAPLSMGFSRQEYWSGLPFPSPESSQPRDQTHVSYIAGGSFTSEPCGKFRHIKTCVLLALFLWRTLTHDYRLKLQNQIRNHHPHFVFYFIIMCSHEIKRHMLLGRKAGTNLDILLKSRHITLPTKVSIPKAMVFPVVMYGCESWTIKKTECWIFDTFKLWCWRRLSRVLWIPRWSNQSILKEINPEYSLQGLMLKLKLQSFGHLMPRADSLEKTLILGKIKGKRRRGQDELIGWHHWLDEHDCEQTLRTVEDRGAWCAAVRGIAESDMTSQLNNNKDIFSSLGPLKTHPTPVTPYFLDGLSA